MLAFSFPSRAQEELERAVALCKLYPEMCEVQDEPGVGAAALGDGPYPVPVEICEIMPELCVSSRQSVGAPSMYFIPFGVTKDEEEIVAEFSWKRLIDDLEQRDEQMPSDMLLVDPQSVFVVDGTLTIMPPPSESRE